MSPIETIIANIIMFAGCVLLVLAGAAPKARWTVALQTGQLFLAAAANVILGGYTGAALNLVSIARNAFVLKDRYRMPVRVFFVCVMAGAGLAANNRGLLGYGIILGNTVYTAGLGRGREETIKLLLAFCIFWWAMYDCSTGNIVGACFDVLTFVSSLIAFFRIRRASV